METKKKVLFVTGGNSNNFEISPFIKVQGDSLINEGIEVSYFLIKGKGFLGYIKSAVLLHEFLKNNFYDVIHAHYTLSALVCVLTLPKSPIVLSLMGSDAYGEYIGHNKISIKSYYLVILTKLIQPFVSAIICKSEHIASYVYLKRKIFIIPNGINLEKFSSSISSNRIDLGLNEDKKYVLFLGNKHEKRKNYDLVKKAMRIIDDQDILLYNPYPISHAQIPLILNSVNCLVVPSFMEGSPNVVKEAMACNCPIVATDVGDIRWLFGNQPGHFLSDFNPDSMAQCILDAINFSTHHGRTKGRERLLELKLGTNDVAQKIIKVYNSISNE